MLISYLNRKNIGCDDLDVCTSLFEDIYWIQNGDPLVRLNTSVHLYDRLFNLKLDIQ
jgi:hypothetical protein